MNSSLKRPSFNKTPEPSQAPEEQVAPVAEDVTPVVEAETPVDAPKHAVSTFTDSARNMLFNFIGRKPVKTAANPSDIGAVRKLFEELRGEEVQEFVVSSLNAGERSCIVVVGVGMHPVCPDDHALVRYNNTNVLINNSFSDMGVISYTISALMASPSKELEIYQHDPMRRIVNDVELEAILSGSDGVVTEVKNYNQSGELCYHAIKTI